MKRAVFISLLLVLPLCAVLIAGSSGELAKEMAVTVDDLPFVTLTTGDKGPAGLKPRTAKLIDSFIKNGIPAVGFVNANKLFKGKMQDKSRILLLEMWLDAGLEFGNHTYSHPDYHRLGFPQFKDDLIKGEPVIKDMLEKRNMPLRYFRHPFLHTGDTPEKRKQLDKLLAQRGYTVAPVTIDNSEWMYARAYHNVLKTNDKKELNRIVESYLDYMDRKIRYFEDQASTLFGRDIRQVLLIHANELNADHFHRLAALIKKRGYNFITLENALKDPAYQSADTYTGKGGISWIHRWALSKGKRGEFFRGEPEAPDFIKKLAGTKYE